MDFVNHHYAETVGSAVSLKLVTAYISIAPSSNRKKRVIFVSRSPTREIDSTLTRLPCSRDRLGAKRSVMVGSSFKLLLSFVH